MASGRAQADFQPMPLPQLRLSVEDQCRLRDRSTIMARQMYATQGSDYADAQVSTFVPLYMCEEIHIPLIPNASLQTHSCQYVFIAYMFSATGAHWNTKAVACHALSLHLAQKRTS